MKNKIVEIYIAFILTLMFIVNIGIFEIIKENKKTFFKKPIKVFKKVEPHWLNIRTVQDRNKTLYLLNKDEMKYFVGEAYKLRVDYNNLLDYIKGNK